MTPFQLFRTIALALILPAASGAPTFAQTGGQASFATRREALLARARQVGR